MSANGPSAPVLGPRFVVDCHAHVMRRGLPLDPARHSEPEVDVDAVDFLALIRSHGVTHGVLTAPSFYGTDNTLLLDALAHCPEHLRAVVAVEPDIDRQRLLDWHRLGVCGIRFNLFRRQHVPDFSQAPYQSLFDHLGQLGWHVEVYIESERFAPVITPIVRSGVRLVLDHFGSPTEPEGVDAPGYRAVLAAIERGEVWVKLSAPYRLGVETPRRCAAVLLGAGGPGCLLWASDWPWVSHAAEMSYARCLDGLGEWIPNADLRTRILSENPRRPFRF